MEDIKGAVRKFRYKIEGCSRNVKRHPVQDLYKEQDIIPVYSDLKCWPNFY